MKSELQEHIREHLNWGPIDYTDRVRFLALAINGETGELANYVKKEWRDGTIYRAEIIKELADIGNYLYMLAEVYGIDIEQEMLTKLLEVEQRVAWKDRH